jgi:enoyl-[acyl-carrier protein] reductase I
VVARAQAKGSHSRLASIEDLGVAVAFLGTNAAKPITRETLYIDGGYHIID